MAIPRGSYSCRGVGPPVRGLAPLVVCVVVGRAALGVAPWGRAFRRRAVGLVRGFAGFSRVEGLQHLEPAAFMAQGSAFEEPFDCEFKLVSRGHLEKPLEHKAKLRERTLLPQSIYWAW